MDRTQSYLQSLADRNTAMLVMAAAVITLAVLVFLVGDNEWPWAVRGRWARLGRWVLLAGWLASMAFAWRVTG